MATTTNPQSAVSAIIKAAAAAIAQDGTTLDLDRFKKTCKDHLDVLNADMAKACQEGQEAAAAIGEKWALAGFKADLAAIAKRLAAAYTTGTYGDVA